MSGKPRDPSVAAAGGPRPTLLVILGPTGTGKSEVALQVAERIGGEIVGCDALQVYRGFDRATAKPSTAARCRIPHHLVDELEPAQEFTMAAFVKRAEDLVEQIAGRGRVPLIVGGTGLYLRGLLRGILDVPQRDPELKERLRGIAARHGTERLHRWLGRLDAESARRLRPGDSQRILRALELAWTGERPWSEELRRTGTWKSGRERYPALKIGLGLEPEALGARTDARVERFFDEGLVEEVRGLLDRGVPPAANAFKAIGYREVLSALRDGCDPQATRAAVKKNTRRYAKRQRTWFRKEPGVTWLDGALAPGENASRITRMWQRFRAVGSP